MHPARLRELRAIRRELERLAAELQCLLDRTSPVYPAAGGMVTRVHAGAGGMRVELP